MALAYRAKSAAAGYATANPAVTLPAGIQTGDGIFILVGSKPDTAGPAAAAGYQNLGAATGGTGSQGIDTGLTRVGVLFKESANGAADSGASVTVTVPGNNVSWAWAIVVSKASGKVFNVALATGSDTTGASAAFSAAASSNPGVTAGDYVIAACCIPTDAQTAAVGAALTASVTQTGVTFGAAQHSGNLESALGQDIGGHVTGVPVSSGTGSGNPTYAVTFTGSTNTYGPALFVRLREVDPPALSTLVDDFTDNTVDTALWPSNYGGVSEVGGRARVPTTTTYAGYQSAAKYTFDQVLVEVPTPGVLGGATTECYTAAWVQSPSNTAGDDIGFEYNRVSGDLRCASRTAYFDSGAVTTPFNATDHRWWRLRQSGSNVLWETSPNGQTWTTQRTLAIPSWLDTKSDLLLLLESRRNNGTDDFAEFDNVNSAPAGVGHTGAASLPVTAGVSAGAAVQRLAAASLPVTAGVSAGAGRVAPVLGSVAVVAAAQAAASVVTAQTAAGSLPVTVGLAAAAVRSTSASASLPVTVGVSAGAAAGVSAQATLAVVAAATAAAARGVPAGASLPVTAQTSAAAARSTLAGASLPVTAVVSTAAAGQLAAASLPVTAGLAAAAVRSTSASAALSVTASTTAVAALSTSAAASLPVTAVVAAAGDVAGLASSSAALAVTAQTSAAAARSTPAGAALSVTASTAAAAARGVPAGASLTVTASTSAVASAGTSTGATVAITATFAATAAVGVPPVTVGAGLAVTAALAAVAQRSARPAAALAVSAAVSTTAAVQRAVGGALPVTVGLSAAAAGQLADTASLAVLVELRVSGDAAAPMTPRPYAGVTARPGPGSTPRPAAGVTAQTAAGVTSRPYEGVTVR